MKTDSRKAIPQAKKPLLSGQRLAVTDTPDHTVFFSDGPRSLTYDELEAAVWSLACEFYDAGIRHTDSVIVQLPNIIELVITDLALNLLGAKITAVQMHLSGIELRDIALAHQPKAYISTADFGGERFTSTHQTAFPQGTLILAFGSEEPESGQLIGNVTADIEALDSCQTYVQEYNEHNLPISANSAQLPINLAIQTYSFANQSLGN